MYIELIDKVLLINTLCFSFLIFVFVMNLSKAPSQFRLIGAAFFIPFFEAAFSFIFMNAMPIPVLLMLCETSLGLMLLLIMYDYKDKRFGIYQFLIIVLPVILSIIAYNNLDLTVAVLRNRIFHIITALIILMDIFYLRKNKAADKYAVQAAISLLGAIILRLFRNNIYLYSISMVLSLFAYGSFFAYFHKTIYNRLMAKVAEAEKLKSSVEKTLNYEVKKRLFEVERSNEQLLNLAKSDQLTKALNKIAILNVIENLINSKNETIFSIMMFDIDNFKHINDTYGHVTGDICIKTLANVAKANIRSVDYLGRYGGDEFVIVLSNLSASEARFVAERFRKRVAESGDPKFTISIGIASFPDDGNTVKELISSADKGLYRSKSRGKNAVSHAEMF